MPQREARMRDWLSNLWGTHEFDLVPASGDASFRRYFRATLRGGETRIVMDAPPEREDCRPFVDVTARLERTGVHVPHIHAQELEQGFLLLEDLGDRLYLGELGADTADPLYRDSITALIRIQGGDAQGLPPYDRELLEREMALFPEWLLKTHLGLTPGRAEQAMLDRAFDRLVRNALAQPRVLVHRDYHSRNLLRTGGNNPGIIDYQDAVFGPVSYDLVSLLRDCYIAWPSERVGHWVELYNRHAMEAGILTAEDVLKMPRWFDLMGVQRHLKAAGIFARLFHRDSKPGYLADIPRTLGYILVVAQKQPELRGLAAFIEARVMPRLEAV